MSRNTRKRLVAFLAIAAFTAIAIWQWPRVPRDGHDSPAVQVNAHDVRLALPKAGFTQFPLRAGQFVPFACEEAFAGLRFWDPLYVTPLPDGSGRLAVVERRGTIQLVSESNGEFAAETLLDIADRVQISPNEAEEGLLGLAFHPQFATADSPHRGEFFVYYVARGAVAGTSTNRLSRFRMAAEQLDRADPDSEQVLIDQPQQIQAHNGGSLLFGPDGFLYLGLGDDALYPPNPNVQTISRNLFSGILRLDVDCRGDAVSHPPPRQPREGRTAGYFIPSDNPFVGVTDALEEFYALGLRNPWRMAFDRATGRLYASDVGERLREEVSVIEPGSNCGWNYAEGTVRVGGNIGDPNAATGTKPNGPTTDRGPALGVETWPLFEYPRDAAHRCIIGGHVYRGRQFPELVGRYIYADQSGRIYALELQDDGRRAGANRLIAVLPDPGIGISSLGEDAAGELYFCAIGELASETGRVFRLRRTREVERDSLPKTLAQTGLFANWQTLEPQPFLVPFDVKVPLWSDGAEKQRWIALPAGERVDVDPHGELRFPPGAVFVKHFDLPTDRRANANSPPRPLETRILVCDDVGGVYGATYRWSPDRREARLVDFNETESLAVVHADGSHAEQTWTYPGRFECAMCHNAASGNVLGFTLRQLDRPVRDPRGAAEPQLVSLVRRQVLAAEAIEVAQTLPGALVPLDDASASLEHRVRSYLDVNCSSCHNPKTRLAAFDARIVRDLGEQGLVDGMSFHHADRGPDVRIVRAGDVALSMLHHRVAAQDPSVRMPPLGTNVVDRRAVDAIAEWIGSLAPSPSPSPSPAASRAPLATEPPADGDEPVPQTASESNSPPR